jgi:hypothetical protein
MISSVLWECLKSETTCHSERPKGVKNPSDPEPKGSGSLETLRLAQGDINAFILEVRCSLFCRRESMLRIGDRIESATLYYYL